MVSGYLRVQKIREPPRRNPILPFGKSSITVLMYCVSRGIESHAAGAAIGPERLSLGVSRRCRDLSDSRNPAQIGDQ
jgi:hypothetical protein